MNQAKSIDKRAALRDKSGDPNFSLQDFYLSQVKLSPGLINDFIPNARMVQEEGGEIRDLIESAETFTSAND